jgi:hypothetical protein
MVTTGTGGAGGQGKMGNITNLSSSDVDALVEFLRSF